jgi:fructose/tagatose bisphosphate aldolase
MVKTLREYIKDAEAAHVAIGHFNISNLEALHGIYNAAKKLNLPVIIGVSEGEQKFADSKKWLRLSEQSVNEIHIRYF